MYSYNSYPSLSDRAACPVFAVSGISSYCLLGEAVSQPMLDRPEETRKMGLFFFKSASTKVSKAKEVLHDMCSSSLVYLLQFGLTTFRGSLRMHCALTMMCDTFIKDALLLTVAL